MKREPLLLIGIAALCALAFPVWGEAAGPWKAQVVDAETGKPLEGVVVLAVWLKMTRTFGGPSPEFYDAEEVITGPDGRFTIGSRWAFTLNPLTYIEGPEFTIFKPGYGPWRFHGWERRPPDWADLLDSEILEKDGIVIELPPLKTREERLKFHRSIRWSGLVPLERTRHMSQAREEDRAFLFGRER